MVVVPSCTIVSLSSRKRPLPNNSLPIYTLSTPPSATSHRLSSLILSGFSAASLPPLHPFPQRRHALHRQSSTLPVVHPRLLHSRLHPIHRVHQNPSPRSHHFRHSLPHSSPFQSFQILLFFLFLFLFVSLPLIIHQQQTLSPQLPSLLPHRRRRFPLRRRLSSRRSLPLGTQHRGANPLRPPPLHRPPRFLRPFRRPLRRLPRRPHLCRTHRRRALLARLPALPKGNAQAKHEAHSRESALSPPDKTAASRLPRRLRHDPRGGRLAVGVLLLRHRAVRPVGGCPRFIPRFCGPWLHLSAAALHRAIVEIESEVDRGARVFRGERVHRAELDRRNVETGKGCHVGFSWG